ncbi:colicin immunity domain-containing protein [Nocardia amikacinitolerans]|uniref:colicin immunity domain-containing protein n=1 Tax=Nocardia amikacinitolerans TaxID=756689 RepID=UPI0020A2ECC8|nr:colicin immunity domain-containing protein [Nocardia amikacinitolerans]
MRSWARPSEVTPGSGIADQLAVMQAFAAGDVTGPVFARTWLEARRKSLSSGERVREPFDRLLNRIFFDIEDYPIDPTLREDGDTTDEYLVADVREVLSELHKL